MIKAKLHMGRDVIRHRGFTLVELLIVVSILAILLSQAVPQISGYYDKKRLIASAEMIYGQLHYARSHAIARGEDIYVQFETDGDEGWALGLSTASTCDPTHGLADSDPCYLIIDDGDGATTVADHVLQTASSTNYTDIKMSDVTFSADRAKFDYVRGTGKAGSVKLESANGYRMKVVTSTLGRVRLCSPAGVSHVSGYPDGSCTW